MSVIDKISYLHNRNNSSNMRRILNQEPSFSPKVKKIDYSSIASQPMENSIIHDNSYLPKIHNNANKVNLNLFNQNHSTNIGINNSN